MTGADEQSYEEMISALQKFVADANEQCEVMQRAGTDCVDNTDNDPAASKANNKLMSCVSGIRSAVAEIQDIAAKLQEELEDIRSAAAKANFD